MRFISPKTDFAFKKIFGSKESEPILVSFLNAILHQGDPVIVSLDILDPYSELLRDAGLSEDEIARQLGA